MAAPMPPKPPPESIYTRILREAQQRREEARQRLAQQIERINTRTRTHGNHQAP